MIKINKIAIPFRPVLIFLSLIILISLFAFNRKTTAPTPSTINLANAPEVTYLKSHPQMTFEDYTKYFKSLAIKKGAGYAYDILHTTTPPTDLHLMAHVIGDVLYAQQGAQGIKICTAEFQYGCSHSIVLHLFQDKGMRALPEIIDACKHAPGTTAYSSCFHGLGHGVLYFAGYNLPKTVELCKQVGEGRIGVEYTECVGGAVMEMVDGGFGNPAKWKEESPKYLLTNDAMAPCDQDYIPSEVKPVCYVYLTPNLMNAAGVNWGNPNFAFLPKAFSYCEQIPLSDVSSRQLCYGGFGKDLALLANHRSIEHYENMTDQNFSDLASWCEMAGEPQGIQYCISFAESSFMWNNSDSLIPPLRLCKAVDNPYKDACYQQLGAMAKSSLQPSDFAGFCKNIPDPFRKTCV